MKNTVADGTIANIKDLTGGYNALLGSATAQAGAAVYYPDSGKFTIDYSTAKSGITVTADKYNDYIIPATVSESFVYRTTKNIYGGSDYKETIYLNRDKEDGKPYVSTVYAKRSGYDEAYSNLVDGSSFNLNKDAVYDVIVSAGNVSGSATYYLAQDNSKAHTLTSADGVFSGVSFAGFDKSKKIYAWVVADNGGSQEVSLKTTVTDIEDNAFIKALKGGTYSIGGSKGISITLPEDWVLIGGKSIDLTAFKFPAEFSYDAVAGTFKIAIGIKIANKDFWATGVNEKTGKDNSSWEFFKQEISGLAKQKEAIESGLANKKLNSFLKQCGASKSDLKQTADKKFGFDASFTGYLEGTVSGGELVIKEGAGILEMGVKLSFDGQYAAVVYGISGGADGSFGLKASRAVCSNDDPIKWDLSLNITPNVKVYAGVGIQKVCSADVYGLLKMPINWSFTNKAVDIALSGEVGIEVKVFIFSTSVELLSGTLGPKYFYYGKETSKAPKRVSAPLSREDIEYDDLVYEISDRSYAENTSSWLGDSAVRMNRKVKSSLASGGLEFRELQTSVYDNSNSQIVTCGDKTVAVWIEDAADRDAYNRTRLVYSVYDESVDSWTAPAAVCDDGYGDAAPSLATDGNKVYVAWQKFRRIFDASTSSLSEILAPSEIYLAEFDTVNDSFKAATRITNDSLYDYEPAVTFKNGSPVVYYCKSAANGMSEADGNTICKYSGGASSVVKSGLSTVFNLAANADEIAYAVDTDGDMDTTEDISVFSGSSSYGLFERVNDCSYMNFCYGELNGTDTLFVADGSNIYYLDGDEIKTVLEKDSVISGQIIAVNTNGNTELFWASNNEVGNELYSCSYSDGKWSGATKLTSRGGEFSNISMTVTSGNKVIGLCNETERVLDSEETGYIDGASNLVAFTADEFTDMKVALVDVDEMGVVPGNTATVYVAVENNGNKNAASYSLTLTDDCGTNTTFDFPDGLAAGKDDLVEIEYTVPSGFDCGDINVALDIENDVNVADNSSSYVFEDPELILTATSLTNDDQLYVLNATLSNANCTVAKNVTVSSYFDAVSEEPFDAISIGDISNTEFKSVEFMFTESDIIEDADGNRFVYLIAKDDADNDATLLVSLNRPETVCGHPVLDEAVVENASVATCLRGGQYDSVVYCSCCGQEVSRETKYTDKLAHTPETVPAVTPTCVKAGYTEGSKCAVCGEILVAQEMIPAKGHGETEVRNAKSATCTEVGYTGDTYCKDCDQKIANGEAVPATGHAFGSWTVVKSATCAEKGSERRVCENNNNHVETREIAATGQHSDADNDGVCDVCGTVLKGPETPSTDPTAPSSSDPTAPYSSDPTAPSSSDPTTPSSSDPTAPSSSDPTAPSASDPTTPTSSDPTTPSASDPTTPSSSDPTTPTSSDPTTPTSIDPTTPSSTDPTTPSSSDTSTEPTTISTTTGGDQPVLPDSIFINPDEGAINSSETADQIKYSSKAALTKSELVAAIVGFDGAVVTVRDKDGDELADDATPGTGSTVTVTVGETTITKTVILLGDVDGNGSVNAIDARLALRAAAKLDTLTGAFAVAADPDQSNTINATDARMILRAAAKLDDPAKWLTASA